MSEIYFIGRRNLIPCHVNVIGENAFVFLGTMFVVYHGLP